MTGMFRREREVIAEATETVSGGINVALVVAALAVVLASVAVVISVSRS